LRENLAKYFLIKVFEITASLFVLATLLFFLLKALPGGPFVSDSQVHPLVYKALEEKWNLQGSVGSQYLFYGKSLLSGDLGPSMNSPDISVAEVIRSGLSSTLLLNLVSCLVVFALAFGLSLLAMRYRGGYLEKFIDQFMIVLISLPGLFLGPFLIFFFGFYLNILPIAFLTSPVHYILPVMALSLRPMAYLVRVLKNSLQENIHSDFARTATAKGLTPWTVLVKHVLRNSLIPVLSYSGPLLVSLISGSFLVEILFGIPGLGSGFVQALSDRDYTVIAGLTLFFASLLIVINSLLDIAMRFIDPRLQEET
jgi:oligopeptide transport system permease protein